MSWVYDPVKRVAVYDYSAGVTTGDYELVITSNVKNANGVAIVNSKIINFSVYDYNKLFGNIADGGSA